MSSLGGPTKKKVGCFVQTQELNTLEVAETFWLKLDNIMNFENKQVKSLMSGTGMRQIFWLTQITSTLGSAKFKEDIKIIKPYSGDLNTGLV